MFSLFIVFFFSCFDIVENDKLMDGIMANIRKIYVVCPKEINPTVALVTCSVYFIGTLFQTTPDLVRDVSRIHNKYIAE